MTRLDDVQALADAGGIIDHVDEADGEKYRSFVTPRWEDVRGLLAIARAAEGIEALAAVSNAYGCFAGCTGSLPGAPSDGSGHSTACAEARAFLAATLAALADFEAGRDG